MKILHTADWHIGQLFHEYDRTYEHQQFLNWLVKTLQEETIDVLLISGDVFDLSNPSAAAIKMFYRFLNNAVKANPGLQIVITAGNHDSASRLESPKPLLESSKIHIVGLVEKDAEDKIDYDKIVIPIHDAAGEIKAWCMAIPFLRMGDYPAMANCDNPYAEGVAAMYKEAYEYAANKQKPGQAIIAMGHLHTQQAEVSDMDKSERLIMGGVECISASAFPAGIAYVALGHIHKAQRIGGREHIRYSGSPIPMSFSEANYKHQVIVFDLDEPGISNIRGVEIPVTIPLLKVPAVHSSLEETLKAISQLAAANADKALAPYLEVRVLLDGPEPGLRHKIETVLEGKNVRLATINTKYPGTSGSENSTAELSADLLDQLKPADLFSKVYKAKYNSEVPAIIQQLFNKVAAEIAVKE